MRGRLWLLYLAGGLVAAVGSLRLPDLQASIAYELVGLSAMVSILIGMRLHRPARRGIWYTLAAGLGVFVAGDAVYIVYVYLLHREPFPSPADGLNLASYPLLAASLLVMIRSRTGGRDRAGLIDALIITTGLGLLSWTFLMRPIAGMPPSGWGRG